MASTVHNLRILGRDDSVEDIDLLGLFHQINRIIPENQKLLTIPPNFKVRDAVELMRKHQYSQLPVVQDGEVLGVFSYRSFAKEAANSTLDKIRNQGCAPGDLTVDECLEKFDFANVKEEMNRVFDALERDNGVLIGSQDKLIALLAPMDILRYLYRVANPFVMLSEIELTLRALIRRSLSDGEVQFAAKRVLTKAYGSEENIPVNLEEMSFDNYRSIISYTETWPSFELLFGGTRNRTSAKLKEISDIRNCLFHFKREVTVEDHQTLADHRDWLLSKVKQANKSRISEAGL